jgi:immune inhibitor A
VKRAQVATLGVTLAAALGLTIGQSAVATPAHDANTQAPKASGEPQTVASDELPNPLEAKRRALREEAITSVLNGEATPVQRGDSTVVKLGGEVARGARDQGTKPAEYVEVSRQSTDRVFVILAEFGNQRHPSYPDQDTDPDTPGPALFDGPLRNEIPEPDHTVDNSTVWQSDYNRAHFENMYFGEGQGVESLKTYYETQSSGRFSVSGTVTDWVKVQYNEARYGRSNGFPCASNVCTNTWALVRDAANTWYADQLAQGRPQSEVDAELATFDQWDRYDFDGDGNFNEPDGYIDHFQIVHAGGDQADGDPWQGEDAIWSHRWYAFQGSPTGPPANTLGGTQIGTSGIWIGDYTIQPENGGRSVFFHEFGHDLGLPDDYNILSGGDNNNEHWTLMAQSRLGAQGEQFIGDRAGDLGAWNKLQLGWLDYETVVAGSGADGDKTINLGPEEYNSNDPQAAVVVLPKKEVVTELGAPAAGTRQWYSGAGNGLENTMTREVTLPADPATLTFQARWDIEDCGPDPCDYAYVEASTDGGATWSALPGSIAKAAEGNGIDGTQATYSPATFDLSAYANQTIGLRFRYSTDPAAQGNDGALPDGIFVDEIAITAGGATVLSDGAEATPNGWTLAGWSSVEAQSRSLHDNYYIAGHRSYVSYDQYLKTGPYYFGYLNTRPDYVDHYAYQPGLLVSYWDTSYADNDTFAHPGSGRNLYVDAHPAPFYRLDGQPWRARVQVYDAPFSLRKADSFTLHHNSQAMFIRGQAEQPVFNDTKTYWYPALPNHGVKLPAVGVKIRVQSVSGTSMKVRVTS